MLRLSDSPEVMVEYYRDKDKQAIIERVQHNVEAETNCAMRMDTLEIVLATAGHFDLLTERDALRKVAEAAREVVKPMTDFPKLLECRRKLKQALADLDALDGGGE